MMKITKRIHILMRLTLYCGFLILSSVQLLPNVTLYISLSFDLLRFKYFPCELKKKPHRLIKANYKILAVNSMESPSFFFYTLNGILNFVTIDI